MFDFATRDLSLTIVHDLIFLLFGVLAFEIGVIRPSMKREDVLRVAIVRRHARHARQLHIPRWRTIS
jgi:uncharacterized membrane protein